MIYALDTNIVSYVVNGSVALAQKLRAVTAVGNKAVLPLMVYYETKRGLLSSKATAKMQKLDTLCMQLAIPKLTQADMNTAANIYTERRRIGRPIDDADLLIAAQCITNGYTLVTNNTKHFEGIDGLKFVNWVE
jgi:predicted nucleic acid-binding protein